MAIYFVSSVSGDNSDGLTWAKAKTSAAGGVALGTASGDIVYFDSAHTEAPASAITLDAPTADTYVAWISVNRNGNTGTGNSGWQTMATGGGSITVGANANALNLTAARSQSVYMNGLKLVGNSGASSSNQILVGVTAANSRIQLWAKNCTFTLPGSGTTANLTIGTASAVRATPFVRLIDCTINGTNSSNAAASVIVTNSVYLVCSGLTIGYGGASKPVVLLRPSANGGIIEIIDSDLSGYNSSSSVLVNVGAFYGGSVLLVNCKLDSTPSKTPGGTWQSNTASVTYLNSSSSDTKGTFEYYTRLGSAVSSTSVYANDGFTQDATHQSLLIATTAAANEAEPFRIELPTRWISSTSAQTFTVEYVRDSAVTMNNQQIWAEFERVSDASFPLGTLQSVRNTQPFDGTPVNWGSGAASWTGTGGSATTGKITSGSVTPAEKSILRTWLLVAVASITDLYVDAGPRIA